MSVLNQEINTAFFTKKEHYACSFLICGAGGEAELSKVHAIFEPPAMLCYSYKFISQSSRLCRHARRLGPRC